MREDGWREPAESTYNGWQSRKFAVVEDGGKKDEGKRRKGRSGKDGFFSSSHDLDERRSVSHALAGRIFRGSSTILPAFTFRTYDLIREHVRSNIHFYHSLRSFRRRDAICISSMLNISDQTQSLDAKEYAPSLPVHGILLIASVSSAEQAGRF